MLRFAVEESSASGFLESARAALAALAARPGYRSGTLARAFDDPSVWCLVTDWESVGAYRRALGAYDVKVQGTALLSQALPEPSAFEPLAWAEPGQEVVLAESDRAGGSRAGIASRP